MTSRGNGKNLRIFNDSRLYIKKKITFRFIRKIFQNYLKGTSHRFNILDSLSCSVEEQLNNLSNALKDGYL